MARDPKIEVAALNVRIPEEKHRNYVDLLEDIASIKRGVKVYGDNYVAISHFNKKTKIGIISKYTEIDIDGDWFDIEDFDVADHSKIDEVRIPKNLKPNLSQFYFVLDERIHVIAFEVYSESRGMSSRSFEKYFREILSDRGLFRKYGRVESDVVKNYGEVERLLSLSHLKEVRIIIRRPNSDDVGEDLAKVIEERLRKQNASELEEVTKSRGADDLKPDKMTHDLANIAAENGEVKIKSLVNGVLKAQDTSEHPLTEVTTYNPDTAPIVIFQKVAAKVLQRVSDMRERSND